jgi:hypothetical protein
MDKMIERPKQQNRVSGGVGVVEPSRVSESDLETAAFFRSCPSLFDVKRDRIN